MNQYHAAECACEGHLYFGGDAITLSDQIADLQEQEKAILEKRHALEMAGKDWTPEHTELTYKAQHIYCYIEDLKTIQHNESLDTSFDYSDWNSY